MLPKWDAGLFPFHDSTNSPSAAVYAGFISSRVQRWTVSECRAGHGRCGVLPDDHVTALWPQWCALEHLCWIFACIISNSEIDVALSSTEDKLSSSHLAATRGSDQTTWCCNDEPDSLSVPMVWQLGCRSAAIWDGNSFWSYRQGNGVNGTTSCAHPQTARDDGERRDLERCECQEGLA